MGDKILTINLLTMQRVTTLETGKDVPQGLSRPSRPPYESFTIESG